MKSSDSTFSKILVGVVIALLAGGSSPWWWCKVFSCSEATQSTQRGTTIGSVPTPEGNGPSPGPEGAKASPSKPSRYTGEMGPLEEGISYNQGDLYDEPASSPEDCRNLCYNDDRCIVVTFIKSQHRCWVKNAIGPIGRSSDMVSSRKLVR